MKINESLRVVQNSNDYLIISETENVWYNKLCTLSTKKLKISNFFWDYWCCGLAANFFHTHSSSDFNLWSPILLTLKHAARHQKKISLKFVILRCLFSQNDYYIIKYHNVAHFLQSKIIGLSHIWPKQVFILFFIHLKQRWLLWEKYSCNVIVKNSRLHLWRPWLL